MPGCSVSLTTENCCSDVNRRRRATLVMTCTFENVSDLGVCLGICQLLRLMPVSGQNGGQFVRLYGPVLTGRLR
jgi:hypothetical protein